MNSDHKMFAAVCAVASLILPAPAAQPTPAEQEPRVETARDIVRLATLDLRAVKSLSVEDYQTALILFGFAHELDPGNTDTIRRQIEAAHNAGDQAAVVEHTRALLLRDPTDVVATLRLITSLINRDHNTAESRLTAYDKVIADSSLDPSIRSRLALDAALLLRERGDEQGFKDRLVQSLQLDSTHKEAAALAATFFAERVHDDAAGRIDLLVNLLKADPLDPNIHMSIARELVVAGAYRAALRFHTNALTISSVFSRPGEQAIIENRVIMWYSDGPAAVLKQLSDTLAVERDTAARAIRKLVEARRPTDDATKPEDVYLPSGINALYVLAADAAGDAAAAASGIRDLTTQVDKLVERLRSPRTRGNISEQAAAIASLEAIMQLNLLRLWLDLDAIKFTQSGDLSKSIRSVFPDAADLLDALWELRAGRPEETISRCAPLLPNRTARIATALAHEQMGNAPLAIDLYREVIKAEPLQPVAAWARSRMVKLGGEPDSANAPELARLVADPRVPSWIDEMVLAPHRFLRVTATVASREVDATDYFPVRITVTNQSPIPLAFGSDRPLCSRFLLVPKMDHTSLERLIRPEVVDLDRKLRLLPRESISVDVWPAPGETGWILDGMANRNLRVRWRLTQGFISSEGSSFRPGPMCIVTETDAVLFRPLAASSLSSVELASAVVNAPIQSLRRLAGVTRSLVLQPLFNPDPLPAQPDPPKRGQPPQPPVVIPPTDLKPVAGALTLRYPKLAPVTRAMLLAVVPHARLAPDLAAFDAVAREDKDPLNQCLYLMTRVAEKTDEYLVAALTSEDPRVRQVARTVERRLTEGVVTYSRLTPEVFRAGAAPLGSPGGEPAR